MAPSRTARYGSPMSSLAEVMARLQREIAQSLEAAQKTGEAASPRRLQWEVDRVTLQLQVELDLDAPEGRTIQVRSRRDEAVAGPASLAAAAQLHTLNVEFYVRPTGALAGTSANSNSRETAESLQPKGVLPQTEAERQESLLVGELTELLGPPGFDSSARAAVVCDAFRQLEQQEGLAVAAALTKPVREIPEQKIRQARHLIRGVVQSGPLKSPERAASLVGRWLEQRPISDLVRLIEAHWRTDHW
jgi:hypothetical protein